MLSSPPANLNNLVVVITAMNVDTTNSANVWYTTGSPNQIIVHIAVNGVATDEDFSIVCYDLT